MFLARFERRRSLSGGMTDRLRLIRRCFRMHGRTRATHRNRAYEVLRLGSSFDQVILRRRLALGPYFLTPYFQDLQLLIFILLRHIFPIFIVLDLY